MNKDDKGFLFKEIIAFMKSKESRAFQKSKQAKLNEVDCLRYYDEYVGIHKARMSLDQFFQRKLRK